MGIALRRKASASPKVPSPTGVNVVPSRETSRRHVPSIAVVPTPQPCVGSISMRMTSTASASRIVTVFSPGTLAGESVRQAEPASWSRRLLGPHPLVSVYGPVPCVTRAPPA